MTPYFEDDRSKIYLGDCLSVLKKLPSNSVQCVVTSPPYWALRDYQTAAWTGGSDSCDHKPARLSETRRKNARSFGDSYATNGSQLVAAGKREKCEKCGATKEDFQLGLEPTPDEYISNMVNVFREVRRVLRDDGTLWLNIGDTYAVSRGASQGIDPKNPGGRVKNVCRPNDRSLQGYKPKDLIGIPWMLVFALRADGWYLRSEIVWRKLSPMPESVKDRPTKSHEQVFLLAKSPKYYYDSVGSQEDCTGNAHSRGRGVNIKAKNAGYTSGNSIAKGVKQNSSFSGSVIDIVEKRNMRSVWSLASFPLKSAHFAAYPPELVRRCLSAGVSEKGCCLKCNKPWERIVEKRRVPTRPGTSAKHWKSSNFDLSQQRGEKSPNRDPQRHITETVTIGWNPACSCEHSEPARCTVLDPFHGAGTTWKVCQRLGLSYIGIELNPQYIDLSIKRPEVYFPHERKRKTNGQKQTQRNFEEQLELF
ncbi:MAG: site-specific DNA-methyltransferase [Pirellulales bacterium]